MTDHRFPLGPLTATVCILGETPSVSAVIDKKPFSGWEEQLIHNCLLKAGIHPDDVRFELVAYHKGKPTSDDVAQSIKSLNGMPQLEVIIALGNTALELCTGHTSIDKWHLSPVDNVVALNCRKCVPTFHPKRIAQDMRLQLYMVKAFMRAAQGLVYKGPWLRKTKRFILNPNFDETIDVLKMLQTKDILANDIETGNGIINTVGFAWSESDAIAIQTLPERFGADKFYVLWEHIAFLLQSPNIRKIYQNLIYESAYYSRYGIRVAGTFHDTMWAQRLLYPEFEIGLDNVGRLYTNEQYWKDIGKDYKGEGKKRDWGNIRDWNQHYVYNSCDTTGTFEACTNQRKDLQARGQLDFFDNYLMRLADPIVEMCSRGLPVNEATRRKLQVDTEIELKQLVTQLSEPINPKSWKQKAKLLKSKGYKLPTKRNIEGNAKESTDELALKKLRLKYPDDMDIATLLKLAKLNKALGSYINIAYDNDGRMRFSLNGVGTETLRFASYKDPWGRGLNAQTLPKAYKIMFDAPPGKLWLQVDLKQAESRFVAYECADVDLIKMLEDSTKDVHRFVASHIFEKPEAEITKQERQLGKKSGHGANYDMRATTFMESCLKEMDLVLTKAMCEKILSTYHMLFPGIKRGHQRVRESLWTERKLVNPLGYTRYFYGRMDEDTFREAYAFKPQSTIPMVVNHLMLHLTDVRKTGAIDFDLHLQAHDSILLMVNNTANDYLPITRVCMDYKAWHPKLILSGGELTIPVEIELGTNLGKLEVLQL